MKTPYRVLCLVVLAALLHLTLGWEWTAAAGLAAGYVLPRGWLAGAVVVSLDYLVFTIFSFARDAAAVHRMTETMGGFLGNMPSSVVVALTLLIGTLIGASSGAAGTQMRRMVDLRRTPADPAR